MVNTKALQDGLLGSRTRLVLPMMIVAAVAVILFSLVAIATMMGVIANPRATQGEQAVPCAECGVVESVQTIESERSLVVRVRMDDGSYRTIYETLRPGFSAGQRVRVENGTLVARG